MLNVQVEVDDTLGSLSRLSEKILFKTALDQHNAGKCMDLFRVYCIGQQFMMEDRAVMISFSNVWNLLNFWKSVSSGYDTQIVMDVTHKCSTAAVNKHGIGVNILGGKAAVFNSHPSSNRIRGCTNWGLPRHAAGSALSYGCEDM